MSNKKKAHKRKRISKHILKAQERQKEEQEEGDTEQVHNTATTKLKKKKRVPNSKVKDPKEAQEYLSNWNLREKGSEWKFNKNTQSWIFRHMYDSNKIPKASFNILLEYISGLQGSTCDWVKKEATRKALRYKEWEKQNTDKEGEKDTQKATEESKQNDDNDDDQKEDDKRFMSLSDHDKRKEYKRCRKVLDQMKMIESTG